MFSWIFHRMMSVKGVLAILLLLLCIKLFCRIFFRRVVSSTCLIANLSILQKPNLRSALKRLLIFVAILWMSFSWVIVGLG